MGILDRAGDMDEEDADDRVTALLNRVFTTERTIHEPQPERYGCYYDITAANSLSHKDVIIKVSLALHNFMHKY